MREETALLLSKFTRFCSEKLGRYLPIHSKLALTRADLASEVLICLRQSRYSASISRLSDL
jgi:hypothetical protein